MMRASQSAIKITRDRQLNVNEGWRQSSKLLVFRSKKETMNEGRNYTKVIEVKERRVIILFRVN